MSIKLRRKIEESLIAIAKESNVSPSVFISELATAFLNICGWVCDALGYTEEERNQSFDNLIKALKESINKAKKRRAKNGTI